MMPRQLFLLVGALALTTTPALAVTYGPGGLPDLSAYRVGEASFAEMAQGLGQPRSLTTDGTNQVAAATWWFPAQGYAAPAEAAAGAASQQVVQAATGGFFSRLKSRAVGTVAGMVPGVGGVVAAQAADAVSTSAVVSATSPTPGWSCIAIYKSPAYHLMTMSCRPQAYLPMH